MVPEKTRVTVREFEWRPGGRYLPSVSDYRCHAITRPLDASVTLPGSKSITNRALIAAALADGNSLLSGALLSEDTRLMVGALQALEIPLTIDEADSVIEVTGCRGYVPSAEANLWCGNAGTVMRFCTALAAASHGRFRLDGVERMRHRPIGALAGALQALGAGVEFVEVEGYPPLIVHGNGLRGGQIALASPPSSQMVSALLLVGPYAYQDLLLQVTGTVPSMPYLKLTTALMERFGVSVVEQVDQDGASFIVAAPQRYHGQTLSIEPDASNATYFLAAPAVAGGRVCVEGLGTGSIQGDVRFVDVLERMGCRVEREPGRLTVHGPEGGDRLRGVDVDLNDMPDAVQTLAVIALFADGPTNIRNVANLRIKETDRLAALATELSKLKARVEERTDGLHIVPPAKVVPAEIDTYDDHRMAMSFALAGLRCDGIVLRNADCCAKTFPDFFKRYDKMCRR